MDLRSAAIRLSEVTKSFQGRDDDPTTVLRHVNFEVRPQEVCALLGTNGSGKTTLLNIAAGVLSPDSGSVERLPATNGPIGFVWQDYRSSLLPWASVAENVAFPMRLRGVSKEERRSHAESQLSLFELTDYADARCHELSGGQQQLVALIRALASSPAYLLLDEPLAALDSERTWRALEALESAWMERPIPTIIVSHDIDEAILASDRVALLSKASGSIGGDLSVPLPRPRSREMLLAPEHASTRNEILEFLLTDARGATRRSSSVHVESRS